MGTRSGRERQSANRQPAGVSYVLGIAVTTLTGQAVIDVIDASIQANGSLLVGHVNAHAYEVMRGSKHMRCFYERADLVYCDGYGVWLAALAARQPLPPRFTGADWLWDLMALCHECRYRVFLLGGKPGVAEATARSIKQRYPEVQIVGTHHGYFNKSSDSDENGAVLEQLNAAKPNLLVVGFGMPIQEEWTLRHHRDITADVILTQGAVMDYMSGSLRRGPTILTRTGLEWLARLVIEPRRLWRRYLVGLPLFLWRALTGDPPPSACEDHPTRDRA